MGEVKLITNALPSTNAASIANGNLVSFASLMKRYGGCRAYEGKRRAAIRVLLNYSCPSFWDWVQMPNSAIPFPIGSPLPEVAQQMGAKLLEAKRRL